MEKYNDNDFPSSPHSPYEQRRILNDLNQSLQEARGNGDVSRVYHTTDAIEEFYKKNPNNNYPYDDEDSKE